MKACLLHTTSAIETNPLEFGEVVTPQPKSGEVLVRVRACGVCRTDLHVIEGELPLRKSPVIPGHQVVGIVEGQGENTRRFAIGDRVGIAWLHRTDGTCEYCKTNAENLCDNPVFTGYSVDGGYAEYIVAPEDFIYTIPAEFPGRCGSPGSKRVDASAFMVSEQRRTLRFRWPGTGMWMCLLPLVMFAIKNWHWSWARCGPEGRMMNLRRSWTPRSSSRRPEKSFRRR